jgi:ubiquinone/menaquinone biosynthesis C-methylase UbiE
MEKKQRVENLDQETVRGFGDEWERFPQDELSKNELKERFDEYFSLFPWSELSSNSIGYDMGCGSGRWAKLVAERVGTLNCIEPSEKALAVAKKQLVNKKNCRYYNCSVDQMPFPDNSQDFGYSLGVLHHIPDTASALMSCVRKLKPGAPLLLYLYYAFDNKPSWYRWIWRMSELLRFWISKSPHSLRYALSQIIATVVYYPLARLAFWCERFNVNVSNFPLAYYRKYSYYSMRTDALDRFGTRLEKRFSQAEIESLMKSCDLEKIQFSNKMPFWVVIGRKKT